MLMTEQEARTKWCPHARVNTLVQDMDHANTVVGGAACNRSGEASMTEKPTCIASGCMAWRFVDAEPTHVRRSVSDDRFLARFKEAYLLPDDVAGPALDAQQKAFADSWQPEAPEPGMDLEKIALNDEMVTAHFRRLVHDRRGFCGAFGRPEGA